MAEPFIYTLANAIAPRVKAGPPVPVSERRGGWWPLIREAATGNWQRNITVDQNTVMSHPTVYSCMTLIAADISKLRIKLVEQDANGLWSEVMGVSPYWPVLRKPNRYQNRIQFFECWILSKLTRGNTYVLKVRDGSNIVKALYVLDPNRVKVLVADDGSAFYRLSADNMAGGEIPIDVTVPASEIIHDRANCLFHPLIGTSPIYAAGVAAMQGLAIQNNSTRFFNNMSRPGGILTAVGSISDETARRLKEQWEANYSGENAGRIAVVGDGLKYEQIMMSAEDAQLIDQLKWTSETICSVFHVPPYKVGIGTMPTYNNIQALNVEYYSQCLQKLMEDVELCLDEGLEVGAGVRTSEGKILGTEFDDDNLLRMDSVTQMDVLDKASGTMTIDEKRRKIGLKPRPNKEGDDVFLQQQNYSLAALRKRDQSEDPFSTGKPETPKPTPSPEAAPPTQAEAAKQMKMERAYFREELTRRIAAGSNSIAA